MPKRVTLSAVEMVSSGNLENLETTASSDTDIYTTSHLYNTEHTETITPHAEFPDLSPFPCSRRPPVPWMRPSVTVLWAR